MKKLIALLIACLLLTAALPALAEGDTLHTFAGIPWDTPKSSFSDVATKNVGIPFEAFQNEAFHDSDPSFIIQDGYYSIWGLPMDDYRGITAHYARTEALLNREIEWKDDAGWVFDSFSCVSVEQPIPTDIYTGTILLGEVYLPQAALSAMTERYGTPTAAYVGLGNRYYNLDYYVVPEEELDEVVSDAISFADQKGQACFKIVFVFNNVLFTMDGFMPTAELEGSYTIRIDYLNHPVAASDFSDNENLDDAPVFPLLHGTIPYIVIEP